jgi:membrane protease YdiL (CAAX protease family)
VADLAPASQTSDWRRFLRPPLVALIAELLILAIPLNVAYRYAMRTVYHLDVVWGVLFALVAALVACNAYVLYARYLARREAGEISALRFSDLARGWLLGALLICTVVAVIALTGDLHLSAGGGPALAGLPGVALLAGVYEELIARGVIFRNLENVFGSEIAIALSAALFGWLHIGNPNATPLSAAAIGLEGGVLLAAVYVYTRSLWWAIGTHMAWNFTQTTLFGIADSGNPGRGLLHAELAGPTWLTGGEFGIEASAIAVAVCAVAASVFLLRAYRRGRIVAPIWERRRQ